MPERDPKPCRYDEHQYILHALDYEIYIFVCVLCGETLFDRSKDGEEGASSED